MWTAHNMKFLIMEPSSFPCLMPLKPKYLTQDPILIIIIIINPWRYIPLRTGSSQPRVGLNSTCPHTEVKINQPVYGRRVVRTLRPLTTVGHLDQNWRYKLIATQIPCQSSALYPAWEQGQDSALYWLYELKSYLKYPSETLDLRFKRI